MVQHEMLEKPVKVYNFEVEEWHTYFVSDSSVLVHNLCAKPKSIHANSHSTTKTTYGYALKNKTTGIIEKYGETTNAARRYAKKF